MIELNAQNIGNGASQSFVTPRKDEENRPILIRRMACNVFVNVQEKKTILDCFPNGPGDQD